MKIQFKYLCLFSVVIVILLFSCRPTEDNSSIASHCEIHSETDFVPNLENASFSFDLDNIPYGEEIVLCQAIPTTSFELVLCRNSSDENSVYIAERYSENKKYAKMTLYISEDMEYDSYKILPVLLATGGSGGAGLLVEFKSGEVTCYHIFEANLSDMQNGDNRFIGPKYITNDEVEEILNNLDNKGLK